MQYLIVDDERNARENLARTLKKVEPEAEIITAANGDEAIEACRKCSIYAAFIDIEMPGMDGIELLKNIRMEFPSVNCIMVTAYSQYALDAIRLHVSGYLIKPAAAADIRAELEDLRIPFSDPPENALLKVRCFGHFEVWREDEILHFGRARAKELLAYLVALKGAAANTGELCGVLFERDGRKEKNYLRQLISELRSVLADCGAENVLITNRNSYSVDTERIDCDLYRAPHKAVRGNIMQQYSWAEYLQLN